MKRKSIKNVAQRGFELFGGGGALGFIGGREAPEGRMSGKYR